MGLYERWVLPRLLDSAMAFPALDDERRRCLSSARGRVLEVGFGSGRNLPWYPSSVERLVAVDPSGESARLARPRIAQASFPVEYVRLAGESIDAPSQSFDCVVSTFTLCSIPEPHAALQQMRRVLKPGGKLLFAEHGLAPDAGVQRWQRRLNRLQNLLFGGCNLDRNTRKLLTESGFRIEDAEQYYVQGVPRFAGFLTRGVASIDAA
ncbi:MAG: class I SAM-dependent methyltransferase [Myxococcales bacterium]|nr:MAG: class I SAM-dependent methyltransferase [Myxococcales bacterium]